MADVNLAFTFVMKNEDSTLSGKVTPEPKGGKARFGVNSLAHPEAVIDGFYEMTKSDAIAYAKKVFIKSYWTPILGNQIVNQDVANKLVDLAFNLGLTPATKILQRSVNLELGGVKIFVDGQMGQKTLTAMNGLDPVKLLDSLKGYAKQYYRDIAYRNPDERTYLDSWLNRVDV